LTAWFRHGCGGETLDQVQPALRIEPQCGTRQLQHQLVGAYQLLFQAEGGAGHRRGANLQQHHGGIIRVAQQGAIQTQIERLAFQVHRAIRQRQHQFASGQCRTSQAGQSAAGRLRVQRHTVEGQHRILELRLRSSATGRRAAGVNGRHLQRRRFQRRLPVSLARCQARDRRAGLAGGDMGAGTVQVQAECFAVQRQCGEIEALGRPPDGQRGAGCDCRGAVFGGGSPTNDKRVLAAACAVDSFNRSPCSRSSARLACSWPRCARRPVS